MIEFSEILDYLPGGEKRRLKRILKEKKVEFNTKLSSETDDTLPDLALAMLKELCKEENKKDIE